MEAHRACIPQRVRRLRAVQRMPGGTVERVFDARRKGGKTQDPSIQRFLLERLLDPADLAEKIVACDCTELLDRILHGRKERLVEFIHERMAGPGKFNMTLATIASLASDADQALRFQRADGPADSWLADAHALAKLANGHRIAFA
jgi:hypothetical protein